jgi:tetraacyldisaccharide-1-P 4'-kinase
MELKNSGFTETGKVLNGRVRYFENDAGINLTVVDGVRGSFVLPSGPVRGFMFGNNAVGLGNSNTMPDDPMVKESNPERPHSRGSEASETHMV